MSRSWAQTLSLLEKLSLIRLSDRRRTLDQLQEAVRFAEQIQRVDTGSVKPLYTVLEQYDLRLRPDQPTRYERSHLQRNARKVVEGYFVVQSDSGKQRKS